MKILEKAIASMTIKQSYGVACVCVGLLKALLVVLCVLSNIPPDPWPLWQTSRPLKHIWSCYRGDNSLSSQCRFGWRKKHCKPVLYPPIIYYFTDPLCLSACWRSTLHPSVAVVSCLPWQTTDGLLFTCRFAQNGQWRNIQRKSTFYHLGFDFILPSNLQRNQEVPTRFLKTQSADEKHRL